MDDLFPLTDEQQKSIEISREQIKNGQFYTNKEVMREMKEWLMIYDINKKASI